MDLFKTLKQKVELLGEGDYKPGMQAILLHIETAHKHLERGRAHDDDPAFTDAIYRTNQAFEGSIKEAYRVLAGKDPAKERPYDIEKYLEEEEIFRSRVLAQLTNYRKEWRNPSAHDYKLDFDESEAFLAIVNVSAFACLLLDQMAEHLAFLKAKAEAGKVDFALSEPVRSGTLGHRVASLLHAYSASLELGGSSEGARPNEVQVTGALMGFIASVAPELNFESERILGNGPERGDLVVSQGDDKVLIELKKAGASGLGRALAVGFLEAMMQKSEIKESIMYYYAPDATELSQDERNTQDGGRIIILQPKKK